MNLPGLFVVGTDTGVGKTLLTGLLLAHLRQEGVHALALKPFCSGSRKDVQLLQALQDKPPRFRAEAFLEALVTAYDLVIAARGAQAGATVKLTDIYNVLNQDAVTNFALTLGPAYKRVTAALDPRVFQVGVRFEF